MFGGKNLMLIKCNECYFHDRMYKEGKLIEFCIYGNYKELKPDQEKCDFFISLDKIKEELLEEK